MAQCRRVHVFALVAFGRNKRGDEAQPKASNTYAADPMAHCVFVLRPAANHQVSLARREYCIFGVRAMRKTMHTNGTATAKYTQNSLPVGATSPDMLNTLETKLSGTKTRARYVRRDRFLVSSNARRLSPTCTSEVRAGMAPSSRRL